MGENHAIQKRYSSDRTSSFRHDGPRLSVRSISARDTPYDRHVGTMATSRCAITVNRRLSDAPLLETGPVREHSPRCISITALRGGGRFSHRGLRHRISLLRAVESGDQVQRKHRTERSRRPWVADHKSRIQSTHTPHRRPTPTPATITRRHRSRRRTSSGRLSIRWCIARRTMRSRRCGRP